MSKSRKRPGPGNILPILLAAALLPAGCGRLRLPPRDTVIPAGAVDGELRRIAERAREEFPGFIRRLQNPRRGERNFRVKYPVPADEESGFRFEELWLGDISFREGRFYGVLANRPFHVRRLEPGDTIQFNPDDITDWFYEQGGRVVGGFSIKALASRLDQGNGLEQFLRRMGGGYSGDEAP